MTSDDPKTMKDDEIQQQLDALQRKVETWGDMNTSAARREVLRAEQIRRRTPTDPQIPPLPTKTRERALRAGSIRVKDAIESLSDAIFLLVQGNVKLTDLQDALGLLDRADKVLQAEADKAEGKHLGASLRYLDDDEQSTLLACAKKRDRGQAPWTAEMHGPVVRRMVAAGLLTADYELTPEGREALATLTYRI